MRHKTTPVDLPALKARAEVLERYAFRRDATAPAWARVGLIRLASSTAEKFAGWLDDEGFRTPPSIQSYLVDVALRRLPVECLGDLAPIVRYYLDQNADPAELKRALVANVHARAALEALPTLLPNVVYDDADGQHVALRCLPHFQLQCLSAGLTPLVDPRLLLDLAGFLPKGQVEAPGRERPTYTAAELVEARELAEACAHLFTNYVAQRPSVHLAAFERRAARECILGRGTPEGAIGTLRWLIPRGVHPGASLPSRFTPTGAHSLAQYLNEFSH